MGFTVDLSADELKSAVEGFKPIPEGIYEVEITSAEMGESKSDKNAGKPLMKMEYKVINADDSNLNGRKLFQSICLWKEAIYSCLQLMKAHGYSTDFPLDVPDPEDFIGKAMKVKVAIEPDFRDPDELSNNVKRILSDGPAAAAKSTRKKKDVSFD